MIRRPLIGMMLGWPVQPDLTRACAVAAAYYGADFYFFYTKDIGETSIAGTKLVDNEWVSGEFPYPDVIYDNTRRRGVKRFEEAYRKLAHVPTGHTIRAYSMSKTRVYNWVKKHEELRRSLIPYITVRDAETTIEFIERHGQAIFKTNGGYAGQNVLTAELKDGAFELFDQQYLHRFPKEEMPKVIDMLIDKKYIVQKLIASVTPQGHAYHLRLHLSKNGQGRWVIAFRSVGLSLSPHVRVTNTELTYRATSTWVEFLKNQFGQKPGGSMERRLDAYGLQMAEYLEEAAGGGFHEIGLDIGIDSDRRIWLFEAGIGLPRTYYYHMQLALPAMAYLLSLLRPPDSEPEEE